MVGGAAASMTREALEELTKQPGLPKSQLVSSLGGTAAAVWSESSIRVNERQMLIGYLFVSVTGLAMIFFFIEAIISKSTPGGAEGRPAGS